MRTIRDETPKPRRASGGGRKPLPPETIDRIIEMRQADMSIIDIATQLGVSKSAVHRAGAGIAVDNRKRLAPPPPWLPRARSMVAGGMSANRVATALGLHSSLVYRWLKKP